MGLGATFRWADNINFILREVGLDKGLFDAIALHYTLISHGDGGKEAQFYH